MFQRFLSHLLAPFALQFLLSCPLSFALSFQTLPIPPRPLSFLLSPSRPPARHLLLKLLLLPLRISRPPTPPSLLLTLPPTIVRISPTAKRVDDPLLLLIAHRPRGTIQVFGRRRRWILQPLNQQIMSRLHPNELLVRIG